MHSKWAAFNIALMGGMGAVMLTQDNFSKSQWGWLGFGSIGLMAAACITSLGIHEAIAHKYFLNRMNELVEEKEGILDFKKRFKFLIVLFAILTGLGMACFSVFFVLAYFSGPMRP